MNKKALIALADAVRNEDFQISIQKAIPGKDCIATAIILGRITGMLADFCEKTTPNFRRAEWIAYSVYGPEKKSKNSIA